MKIKKVERHKDNYYRYLVTLTPNWLEKLFGVKEKIEEFLDTKNEFLFGGGSVYVKRNGEKLYNGHYIAKAIDNFKRAW